jgi:type II secretion system protein D
MPLSIPFLRELFLVTALFVVATSGEFAAFGQDSTPVPAGTTNYQNAQVNSILDLYETLTGKHLIRDANLAGLPQVSVSFTGLNKADTIKMIEQFLLLNGVAIIPIDSDTLKVITVGTNKSPRSEGVKLYSNAAELPKEDAIVSYYMPLNYISPQEAVTIFGQVAPAHNYGVYVPAPTAQAAILTENVSVIRQLIALKNLIDVEPARVTGEWIQVNRADAEKVADILNKMLGQGTTGSPGAPAAGPGGDVHVPAGLGNDEPISNEKNLISGPAQIIPDPRNNRIWISTRPVNLPFLEQMVAQLDLPDTFLQPQRRPLKYVLAQDILPALEAAIAVTKDDQDQVKKDQQAAQSGNNGNGQNRPGGNTQPTSTSGGSSGSTGSVSAITPQLAQPNENDVPTVVTVGKTRILADNRSNSIIVFGSSDVVSRVFEMIDQLDHKPLQVYLATVIGELTVSQGVEFGIDLLQKFAGGSRTGIAASNLNSSQGTTASSSSSTTTTTGGSPYLPEPTSLTSALGFPVPTGLTLYGAIGNTLNAYLRALETTDRFKIISRPSVYTTNNKLAVIASGSQVPVPSSTTAGYTGSTTNNSLTTTSSIAYEDVLLQLDIIPLINANHEVTLQIRQTNNSLGSNVNISGNEIPIINTQEINTEITVPNKSTVVIGGLITDNTTRDASGVPFLSDIPLLGYLFSDTNKKKERDELIIMIQPTVVETDADQLEVNEMEKQRTILGREAVEAATSVPPNGDDDRPAPQLTPALPPPGLGIAPGPQFDTTSVTIRSGPYSSKSIPSHTTTTTTTTITRVPTSVMTPLGPTTPTGPVPALSSPAPDVGNGKMPTVNPPSPTTPPTGSP